MQKNIVKAVCIFTLVFFVMSMTGAAVCNLTPTKSTCTKNAGTCVTNSCASTSSTCPYLSANAAKTVATKSTCKFHCSTCSKYNKSCKKCKKCSHKIKVASKSKCTTGSCPLAALLALKVDVLPEVAKPLKVIIL